MKTNTVVSLVILCGSLAAGGAVIHNYMASHSAPAVDSRSDLPRRRPLGRFNWRRHPMMVEDRRLNCPPSHAWDSRRMGDIATLNPADSPRSARTPEELAAATVACPPIHRGALRRMRKRIVLNQELTATVDGKFQLGLLPTF